MIIKKLLLKDYSDFFKISKENVKEKKNVTKFFSLKYISKSVVVFEVFIFKISIIIVLAVLEVTMANLYARSLGYKVEITQKI